MRTRLLVAEDHRFIGDALERLLSAECDWIGAVSDGKALLDVAASSRPDVVILDIGIPLLNGLDALPKLLSIVPDVKVIVFTVYEEPEYASIALSRGAVGYVLKDCAASELKLAIQHVLQGRTYVTPSIAGPLFRLLTESHAAKSASLPVLTPRQQEVLVSIAQGNELKQIAATLKISRKTVEYHRATLMRTLGLRTTADLVRYALDSGIVPTAARRAGSSRSEDSSWNNR